MQPYFWFWFNKNFCARWKKISKKKIEICLVREEQFKN